MRSILIVVLLIVVGYGLYLGLLYTQQRGMMFPGTAMRWDGVGRHLPEGARRVEMGASFGDVKAVMLPAHDGAEVAPAALYFHGNAEFVDQNLDLLQSVAALGVHVLLVEYPGYAGTDGEPSRDSLTEAARLGYDWLAAQPQVDAARIFAIGRSVGTGAATELSAERPLAALVLLAPFTSVADFARSMGAPAFLARDRFDNRARVAAFDGPVLVVHGRHDNVIPYRHGVAVAAVAREGELVTLGCHHNDCDFFGAEAMARLWGFLAAAGLFASAPIEE